MLAESFGHPKKKSTLANGNLYKNLYMMKLFCFCSIRTLSNTSYKLTRKQFISWRIFHFFGRQSFKCEISDHTIKIESKFSISNLEEYYSGLIEAANESGLFSRVRKYINYCKQMDYKGWFVIRHCLAVLINLLIKIIR